MTNRCRKAPPSGELASIASLRGFPRIAAPPVKMLPPGGPQTFRYHKIKIILLRFSTKISEDVEKPIGGCIFLRKNVVK